MQLNPFTFDRTLEAFVEAWPVERIESMTLLEYADLSDHDSFCYWLEYGTKNLGAIGNNPLTKFGIWKPKHPKDFSDRILYDGEYAWYATKGNDRDTAFQRVRNDVIEIVKLSQSGNWDKIEPVDYHKIAKWKIAFLYSNRQLLPIYSKRALLAIASGLGKTFVYNTDTYLIQRFILIHHKNDEGIDHFAFRLYSEYAEKPNYYVVGTKYEEKNIYPDNLKAQCISIGYLWSHDLSHLKNQSSAVIDTFVAKHRESYEPSTSKLKGQVKKFLSLKPGDIIALKSHGNFNRLTIIAYAVVVKRNGNIYRYNPDTLGHIVNVEFLETGFSKSVGFNYADSIHEIKTVNPHYKHIFGKYHLDESLEDLDESLQDIEVSNDDIVEFDESIYEKGEEDIERSMVSRTIVKQVHNKIQNRFVKALKNAHPNSVIAIEYRKRIDVIREEGNDTWFYEVKPFDSPYKCIRESLGQLLDYSYRYGTNTSKRLITVGPEEPDEKSQKFINYLKQSLGIPYSYLAFNINDSTISEY